MTNYDVGYGKPPSGGRFRKGRSGNPKGRPKGTKNLKTDLAEELQERVVVSERGGARHCISKQRALIKTVLAKALSGDSRACTTALNLTLKVNESEEHEVSDAGLSPDDLALVTEFLLRHGAPPKDDSESNT
jgi:hypothetical protein